MLKNSAVSSGDLFFLCGSFMRGHVSAPPYFDFERNGEFVSSAFIQRRLVWFTENAAEISSEAGRTRGIVYRINKACEADPFGAFLNDSYRNRATFHRELVELVDGLGKPINISAWAYIVSDVREVFQPPDGYGGCWVFNEQEEGAGLFGPHFFDFRADHNTGWFAFDLGEAKKFVTELNRRDLFVHTMEAYQVDGVGPWREPDFGPNLYYGGGTVLAEDVSSTNEFFTDAFRQAEIAGGSYRFEIYADVPEDRDECE